MSKEQHDVMNVPVTPVLEPMEFPTEEKLSFFERAFYFLLPCLCLFEIQLVGRLFISEVILALCLPFLLMRKWHMLRAPIPRTVIMLGALWLVSQILTDIIRSTPFEDYSRGWARIVFFLINFSSLYILLYKNKGRILSFVSGLICFAFLVYFLNPSPAAVNEWWKFGLGVPLAMATVLLCQTRFFRRKPLIPTIIMMIISVLSINLGSRSLGGVCFLTGVYFFIDNLAVTSPYTIRHLSFGNKMLLGISIIIFFFGFQFMYKNILATATTEITEKERSQSEGDYGLFLGGRSEIISSYYAISDSPILGHGSWAKDPSYDKKMYFFLKDAGYKPGSSISDIIPTHSHIWGAWVEAGFLGAIFWGYIFIFVTRVLLKLYRINDRVKYLAVFIGLTLLWDILFSPFGAERRLIQAFNIVLMITVFDNFISTQLPQKIKSDAN